MSITDALIGSSKTTWFCSKLERKAAEFFHFGFRFEGLPSELTQSECSMSNDPSYVDSLMLFLIDPKACFYIGGRMRNATKGRKSLSSVSMSFGRIRLSRGSPSFQRRVGTSFDTSLGSWRIWTLTLRSSGGGGLLAFGVLNVIAHIISYFCR